MNKARVAEAARGIIQKKNVRKDLKVDFALHKGARVYPNLKWIANGPLSLKASADTEQNKERVIKKSQPHGRDFLMGGFCEGKG